MDRNVEGGDTTNPPLHVPPEPRFSDVVQQRTTIPEAYRVRRALRVRRLTNAIDAVLNPIETLNSAQERVVDACGVLIGTKEVADRKCHMTPAISSTHGRQQRKSVRFANHGDRQVSKKPKFISSTYVAPEGEWKHTIEVPDILTGGCRTIDVSEDADGDDYYHVNAFKELLQNVHDGDFNVSDLANTGVMKKVIITLSDTRRILASGESREKYEKAFRKLRCLGFGSTEIVIQLWDRDYFLHPRSREDCETLSMKDWFSTRPGQIPCDVQYDFNEAYKFLGASSQCDLRVRTHTGITFDCKAIQKLQPPQTEGPLTTVPYPQRPDPPFLSTILSTIPSPGMPSTVTQSIQLAANNVGAQCQSFQQAHIEGFAGSSAYKPRHDVGPMVEASKARAAAMKRTRSSEWTARQRQDGVTEGFTEPPDLGKGIYVPVDKSVRDSAAFALQFDEIANVEERETRWIQLPYETRQKGMLEWSSKEDEIALNRQHRDALRDRSRSTRRLDTGLPTPRFEGLNLHARNTGNRSPEEQAGHRGALSGGACNKKELLEARIRIARLNLQLRQAQIENQELEEQLEVASAKATTNGAEVITTAPSTAAPPAKNTAVVAPSYTADTLTAASTTAPPAGGPVFRVSVYDYCSIDPDNGVGEELTSSSSGCPQDVPTEAHTAAQLNAGSPVVRVSAYDYCSIDPDNGASEELPSSSNGGPQDVPTEAHTAAQLNAETVVLELDDVDDYDVVDSTEVPPAGSVDDYDVVDSTEVPPAGSVDDYDVVDSTEVPPVGNGDADAETITATFS